MDHIQDIPDMTALRAHIDAVDTRLITLLAERQALIGRAAQIKARDNLPARIETRVEEVIGNVRRLAEEAGLDPELIATLWFHLIEAAILQEDRHLKGVR